MSTRSLWDARDKEGLRSVRVALSETFEQKQVRPFGLFTFGVFVQAESGGLRCGEHRFAETFVAPDAFASRRRPDEMRPYCDRIVYSQRRCLFAVNFDR